MNIALLEPLVEHLQFSAGMNVKEGLPVYFGSSSLLVL